MFITPVCRQAGLQALKLHINNKLRSLLILSRPLIELPEVLVIGVKLAKLQSLDTVSKSLNSSVKTINIKAVFLPIPGIVCNLANPSESTAFRLN